MGGIVSLEMSTTSSGVLVLVSAADLDLDAFLLSLRCDADLDLLPGAVVTVGDVELVELLDVVLAGLSPTIVFVFSDPLHAFFAEGIISTPQRN